MKKLLKKKIHRYMDDLKYNAYRSPMSVEHRLHGMREARAEYMGMAAGLMFGNVLNSDEYLKVSDWISRTERKFENYVIEKENQ